MGCGLDEPKTLFLNYPESFFQRSMLEYLSISLLPNWLEYFFSIVFLKMSYCREKRVLPAFAQVLWLSCLGDQTILLVPTKDSHTQNLPNAVLFPH